MGEDQFTIADAGEFADAVFTILQNEEEHNFALVSQSDERTIRVLLADGAEYSITIKQTVDHP